MTVKNEELRKYSNKDLFEAAKNPSLYGWDAFDARAILLERGYRIGTIMHTNTWTEIGLIKI